MKPVRGLVPPVLLAAGGLGLALFALFRLLTLLRWWRKLLAFNDPRQPRGHVKTSFWQALTARSGPDDGGVRIFVVEDGGPLASELRAYASATGHPVSGFDPPTGGCQLEEDRR